MASFAGKSNSYIFDGAGGMRDQLEQAILNELQAKKYPLQARIKNVKSGKGLGGMMFGTKEQCVVVDVEDGYQICIANTTVGTYLYVSIYLMVPTFSVSGAGGGTNWALQIGDMFKLQEIEAYYNAATAATESAFAQLGLTQVNSGYNSIGE